LLPDREWGFGTVGELPEPVPTKEFLQTVKEKFGVACLRYSHPVRETVRKIALCSGSGASLLGPAIRSGADVLITGEAKYNSFFDAQDQIVLVEIGHFESEIGIISLLYEILTKNFPTFALHKSEYAHNPVNYL
ncbi:MAG: Nif3-like dinuclear metal center hexameric protein, partial [Rikenellaceae bacterium]|nr:Nif3-like dinuclear metal center hexameric protein [Rikenellaceae bacterium]